jgi:hypothetical protein
VVAFYRLLVCSGVHSGVSLLFTGRIVIGAAVAMIPANLIQRLVRAQVLNGIITPILLTYVPIRANHRGARRARRVRHPA